MARGRLGSGWSKIAPGIDDEIARFEASLSPDQLKALGDMVDEALLKGDSDIEGEPRGLRSLCEKGQ